MHDFLTDYLDLTARTRANMTAFSDEKTSVTFGELKRMAQAIGCAVAKRAGRPREPVVVLTNHAVSDIIAFIGVLYAGCFYVPVDASAPADYRQSRIDAVDPVMVIDGSEISALTAGEPDVSLLDEIRANALGSDPAYAIFTSGSTGVPKPALISHHSVVNLTEWFTDTFGITDRTVFGNLNMFYFDASVQEIYATIKTGCVTRVLDKRLLMSPLKLLRRLDELRISVLPWSTAAVKMIANYNAFSGYTPQYLTDVIFGGENMPAKLLNVWRGALPDTRFVNVYGPTETTVDCAYYIVSRELADDENVPIGAACRNTELLVLDENGDAASSGKGELAVRGAGVGLGYYNDAERTARSFVQNPLNPRYRDIVYLTGDIVQYNSHGELVCLNRKDSQVKHMGSRIELGEIERISGAVGGVELVCCAYDYERSRIALFYQGTIDENALLKECETRMPRYMIPGKIVRFSQMPETPNGKIDRARLVREHL